MVTDKDVSLNQACPSCYWLKWYKACCPRQRHVRLKNSCTHYIPEEQVELAQQLKMLENLES